MTPGNLDILVQALAAAGSAIGGPGSAGDIIGRAASGINAANRSQRIKIEDEERELARQREATAALFNFLGGGMPSAKASDVAQPGAGWEGIPYLYPETGKSAIPKIGTTQKTSDTTKPSSKEAATALNPPGNVVSEAFPDMDLSALAKLGPGMALNAINTFMGMANLPEQRKLDEARRKQIEATTPTKIEQKAEDLQAEIDMAGNKVVISPITGRPTLQKELWKSDTTSILADAEVLARRIYGDKYTPDQLADTYYEIRTASSPSANMPVEEKSAKNKLGTDRMNFRSTKYKSDRDKWLGETDINFKLAMTGDSPEDIAFRAQMRNQADYQELQRLYSPNDGYKIELTKDKKYFKIEGPDGEKLFFLLDTGEKIDTGEEE